MIWQSPHQQPTIQPAPRDLDTALFMKTTIVSAALCLLFGSSIATGLEAQQGNLIRLREKKLKLSFLKEAKWFTDFDKAKAAAEKRGQVIFTYFTRSYAP